MISVCPRFCVVGFSGPRRSSPWESCWHCCAWVCRLLPQLHCPATLLPLTTRPSRPWNMSTSQDSHVILTKGPCSLRQVCSEVNWSDMDHAVAKRALDTCQKLYQQLPPHSELRSSCGECQINRECCSPNPNLSPAIFRHNEISYKPPKWHFLSSFCEVPQGVTGTPVALHILFFPFSE